MESLKIFQIEKNNDDIRKTVLTNTIKMLTERKLLKSENLEKNINDILSKVSDDYTYTINLDTDDADKIFAIKILNQKITAISKQSNINSFLNKFQNNPKIIIVKAINTKALQYIFSNYIKTEIFLESSLMINLVDHVFVPKYEILDKTSDDYKQFCDKYNVKKRQIPKLLKSDPIAKYYNLKKDDIVRIVRCSELSGLSPFYRIVI